MTTKAIAPAPDDQRARLEIIWNTITRDAMRSRTSPDIGVVNSKRYLRIDRTLEELAAMLANGVSDNFDPATDYSESGELAIAIEDIWTFIEKSLIDWAGEIEKVRAARRAA